MPRRIDRRQHRDVDIACGVGQKLRGVLLAARRHRIDVEEKRLAAGWRLTESAASVLDAAVTAEMMMSAPRTASAAEPAHRTPIVSAAALSFPPSACGN